MFDKDEIAIYYDEAEVSYSDAWYLNDCLAMHYGFWEDGVKNLKEALLKENLVLANLARISEKDIVLDAGCGVGGSSIFLAKNYGCKVKGVSLSNNQCKKAKQNASKANISELVSFDTIDYHYTEYPDNYFTVIWALETLGHSDDIDLFFKEANRLLAPGGRIIIADGFATKSNYNSNEETIMNNWLHNWAIQNIETSDFFEKALSKNGFQGIEVFEKTDSIKKSSRKMSSLAKLALTYGRFMRFFGRSYGSSTTIKNSIGGKYQYLALKRKLWEYKIIIAQKK